MSKREETATVEDLYCDQGPCKAVAVGPCVFCPKDLCHLHGDRGMRYMGLEVLMCNNERNTPIGDLFTPSDKVQRRFDEFNLARQSITEAADIQPE